MCMLMPQATYKNDLRKRILYNLYSPESRFIWVKYANYYTFVIFVERQITDNGRYRLIKREDKITIKTSNCVRVRKEQKKVKKELTGKMSGV